MRAALRGVIDFTQARLLDVDWWRRCAILLNAVAKDDDKELFGRIYDYHRALVANSGLDNDSFKRAQHDAKDSFLDLVGVLRPWEGGDAKGRQAKEIEALRQSYIEQFGDPSDPQWQAENDAALAAWRARVEAEIEAEAAIEDDMERVQRLCAERDEKVERLRRDYEHRRIWQGR